MKQKDRVPNSLFRKKNGTGLGLWVSNEIIRKHGDYTRVRNVSGSRGVSGAFVYL